MPLGLLWQPLAREEMILIASRKVKSDDPVQVLQSNPFIRFSRDAVVGTLVEKWLEDNDITVRDTMELASLEAIYGMVLADLGVSIIPEPCMKVANQPPLRRIRLAEDGGPVRELGLTYRKDSTKMRVIEEVTAAIERALQIGTFSPEAIAQAV